MPKIIQHDLSQSPDICVLVLFQGNRVEILPQNEVAKLNVVRCSRHRELERRIEWRCLFGRSRGASVKGLTHKWLAKLFTGGSKPATNWNSDRPTRSGRETDLFDTEWEGTLRGWECSFSFRGEAFSSTEEAWPEISILTNKHFYSCLVHCVFNRCWLCFNLFMYI